HPRTANAYTVGPSPAPGSVRCLQLLGRTWLAPIPESRDHPLHRPFLDKLISENGPAENPQEIILNSLPCKCLFLWDLSRHRFQPDCLLRPLPWRKFLPSLIYPQKIRRNWFVGNRLREPRSRWPCAAGWFWPLQKDIPIWKSLPTTKSIDTLSRCGESACKPKGSVRSGRSKRVGGANRSMSWRSGTP